MNILVTILIGLGVLIVAAVILGFTFYRVADVDKVLIITGGKEPKFIKSGGAIVPPIIRKASYFPLGIITVPAAGDEIRKRGLAEAEMVAAKGKAAAEAKAAELSAEAEGVKAMKLAEAEGERARLLAQAEGEAKLAEARASNDRVNFEIEKIRLETEARVQIATNLGNMMAEVGKNAEFINLGGAQAGAGAGTGNVLIDTLSQIPTLFKSLDVQNNALNGCSMNEQLNSIVSSIAEPVKGLLAQNETTIVENVVE